KLSLPTILVPLPRNALVPPSSSGRVDFGSRSNIFTSSDAGSGAAAAVVAVPRGRSSRSRSLPNNAMVVTGSIGRFGPSHESRHGGRPSGRGSGLFLELAHR